MGYLGRNVNLTLLIIIILVIVSLVGVTVFFQRSLQDKAESLGENEGALAQCQQSLGNYQERYSQAQQKANESAQDIRKYDQLYEQKVAELQDTQSTLLDTQKDKEFEKLQKEKFQERYEAEMRTTQQLNVTVANLQSQVKSLKADIADLRDELAQCG